MLFEAPFVLAGADVLDQPRPRGGVIPVHCPLVRHHALRLDFIGATSLSRLAACPSVRSRSSQEDRQSGGSASKGPHFGSKRKRVPQYGQRMVSWLAMSI